MIKISSFEPLRNVILTTIHNSRCDQFNSPKQSHLISQSKIC